jgi:hypothetical protein
MLEGRRVKYEPLLNNEPEDPGEREEFPYDRFPSDSHGDYVEPNHLGYSDYGGSTVERSNYRVFVEQFAEHQGTEWWSLYGGHGTAAIVVRRDADERVPEIGEFLDALESYPLADEDDHTQLEMELEDDAWRDYGLADFRRWLESIEGETDLPIGGGYRRPTIEIAPLFRRWNDRGTEQVIATLPRETQLQIFETVLGINLGDLDNEYLDNVTDEQLNDIWWQGVRNGTGEEVRHEDAVNVYFDFPSGVRSYLGHMLDQGTLKVALDALLDRGGEWSLMTERLFAMSRRRDRTAAAPFFRPRG